MEKPLYIREMCPGVYLMDEAHEATGYLVVGKDKACMIDTMNGYNDLYRAVRKRIRRIIISAAKPGSIPSPAFRTGITSRTAT